MEERKITALSEQKNDPNRVSLFLDDRFAFGLSKKAATGLSVGQFLSNEQVQALQERVNEESVFNKAVAFIRSRPKTENEVRSKLSSKGIAETEIDKVVERFKQLNWLDDKKYSEMWIENQSVFRPRSKRMLAYELRRKGVSEENIAESLQDVQDDQAAFDCAMRYTRKLRDADPLTFRKKLQGYLARRGFGYAVIYQTVERIQEQLKNTDEDSNIG